MSTPETSDATLSAKKTDDGFYRSSYAIKKDLEPGLKRVTLGLRLSLAEFLSMVAEDPESYIALLSGKAAEHRMKKALKPRSDAGTRAERKRALEMLREADPETIKRMLAAAEGVTAEQ
jgi:hypothetical protein